MTACPKCGARGGEVCKCPPRRDYNAHEQHLIKQGKEAQAKAAWHKRTGK